MKNGETQIGYMCGVAFQHDIEQDAEIFGSIEALLEKKQCTNQCGIVKVEVKVIEWVQEQSL